MQCCRLAVKRKEDDDSFEQSWCSFPKQIGLIPIASKDWHLGSHPHWDPYESPHHDAPSLNVYIFWSSQSPRFCKDPNYLFPEIQLKKEPRIRLVVPFLCLLSALDTGHSGQDCYSGSSWRNYFGTTNNMEVRVNDISPGGYLGRI